MSGYTVVEVTNNGIDYTYGGHTLLYKPSFSLVSCPPLDLLRAVPRDNQRLWLETDRDARNGPASSALKRRLYRYA